MLKNHVVIGKKYVAKISGKLTEVRIDSSYEVRGYGPNSRDVTHWHATNLKTGRSVTIESAAKLRSEVLPKRCVQVEGTTTPEKACANCAKLIEARASFTRQYREAIDHGSQDFAAKIRAEYRELAANTPCLKPMMD